MTEIPTFTPFSFIFCTAAWMSLSASQWTVIASHPASAKASMYLTGSSIIRWASKNLSEYPLTALITGGPNVMLGTNIPSITSRWIQSAPALSVLAISSPSLEKSADRIEGDTLVIGVLMGPVDNSAFASVPTSSQALLQSVDLRIRGDWSDNSVQTSDTTSQLVQAVQYHVPGISSDVPFDVERIHPLRWSVIGCSNSLLYDVRTA